MIEYKTGDILAEGAEALVNTVNCVGNYGAWRGTSVQKRVFAQLRILCCRLQAE
jgi:hypothetical protein